MANFEAITASTSSKPLQKQAEIQVLLDRYAFSSELTVQLLYGELEIYGDAWFEAYTPDPEEVGEPNREDPCAEAFCDELSELLVEGEFVKIMCIGHEKCRWPLCAMKVTITQAGAAWKVLDDAPEARPTADQEEITHADPS